MNEIVIIGGITADIEGRPNGRLIHGDSNPGKIYMSYGGVGRNIAENLGRMGASVALCSVAGDDLSGRGAVRELALAGVDVSGVKLLPEENTAVYMSILDPLGDLELALCNMDALERITAEFISEVAGNAKDAKIIALDTNLLPDTLAAATECFGNKPLFLDPVSASKAERAKELIGRFHTIKPNRLEAEILSEMPITDPESLDAAGRWFLDQGVRQVFITLAAGGVYYRDWEGSFGIVRPASEIRPVSATGAGDTFSAAILYCYSKGYGIQKTAAFGMAAASIAMEARTAVNPMMSVEEIERRLT